MRISISVVVASKDRWDLLSENEVFVIEDVRGDPDSDLVAFGNDQARQVDRQAFRAPLAVVDPDLDGIDPSGREFLNRLARFVLRRDLVGDAGIDGESGTGVRCADAAPGHEEPCAAKLARGLIGAEDPGLSTLAGRQARVDEVEALVAAWTSGTKHTGRFG